MYDFIVVGAGPPGSRFAYQTARAGHDVLLLEKGSIGEPLACSGHVSTDIWEYLPKDAKAELLQNEISGARFHTGSANSRAYPFYKDETIVDAVPSSMSGCSTSEPSVSYTNVSKSKQSPSYTAVDPTPT